jgi:hypothetical protein
MITGTTVPADQPISAATWRPTRAFTSSVPSYRRLTHVAFSE